MTYIYFRTAPGSRRALRKRRTSRARDWRYRAWIRSLPSAVSGYRGSEAAHTGTDGGMSMKASDFSCIPLTPEEHREYHRIGKRAFERKHEIDCQRIVERLNEIWVRYSREVK
jgi:hypothetical protein